MARHDDESPHLPRLRGEVESLFSEVLGLRPRKGAPLDVWNPRLDLFEEADRCILEMDLPGVHPDDVHIDLEGRYLTISGRRDIVRESSGPRFRLRERYHGSFRRTVELPIGIDREGMSFALSEGILRVDLPKRRNDR
jgi:HSP20 family protein